jgi:hypothetical protein
MAGGISSYEEKNTTWMSDGKTLHIKPGQIAPFDYGDFVLKSAEGILSSTGDDDLMDMSGIPVVEAKISLLGYKFVFSN